MWLVDIKQQNIEESTHNLGNEIKFNVSSEHTTSELVGFPTKDLRLKRRILFHRLGSELVLKYSIMMLHN